MWLLLVRRNNILFHLATFSNRLTENVENKPLSSLSRESPFPHLFLLHVCLRLVLSVGKLKYDIFSFFSGILVTFLIAFRYAARGRHYRKQARTLTELLLKLTNQGLTSLVLALFGPGYPSVSPFMEWVYALFVLTL